MHTSAEREIYSKGCERFHNGGKPDQAASVMSSEAMVSFLRKVAPGVEQSLQQNETVDIFRVRSSRYDTKTKHVYLPNRDEANT